MTESLSGLLMRRLIMSLAERLSSKFHVYHRSFASQPNIHSSENKSAADIISRHTTRYTKCTELQLQLRIGSLKSIGKDLKNYRNLQYRYTG